MHAPLLNHRPAKLRYLSTRNEALIRRSGWSRAEKVQKRLDRRLWTTRGIMAWPSRMTNEGCIVVSPWSMGGTTWTIFINERGRMKRMNPRAVTFAEWSRRVG